MDLFSLDFLEKYMRLNKNLVGIDISFNPLTSKEMQKFVQILRKNQVIRNVSVDGIDELD